MELELKKINDQSKKEIQESAAIEARRILDEGWTNPEESLIIAKKLMEYCTNLIKGLESNVRADIDRCGGLMELNGCKLSLSSTGARLNYVEDSVYSELKEKLKAREGLLKTVHKSGVEVADAATGEMIPIVSIETPSKETLIVKY